jgi:hypothetical protein
VRAEGARGRAIRPWLLSASRLQRQRAAGRDARALKVTSVTAALTATGSWTEAVKQKEQQKEQQKEHDKEEKSPPHSSHRPQMVLTRKEDGPIKTYPHAQASQRHVCLVRPGEGA